MCETGWGAGKKVSSTTCHAGMGRAQVGLKQGKLPWKGHPLRFTNWKISLK